MPESYNSKQFPAWEDISLEEIDGLIRRGNVPEALTLTKVRLEALEKISAEISFNRQPGEIPLANWQSLKRDFEQEIAELKKVIDIYKDIPKYNQ